MDYRVADDDDDESVSSRSFGCASTKWFQCIVSPLLGERYPATHGSRSSNVGCVLVMQGHMAVPPAWMAEGTGEHASRWPWVMLGAIAVEDVAIGGKSFRIMVAVRRIRSQGGMHTSIMSGSHLGLVRVVNSQWRRLLRAQRSGHVTIDAGCVLARSCWIRSVHGFV